MRQNEHYLVEASSFHFLFNVYSKVHWIRMLLLLLDIFSSLHCEYNMANGFMLPSFSSLTRTYQLLFSTIYHFVKTLETLWYNFG
ncbi:hypothetical protein Taro_045821, partial [Colocasia esculenta]|nr:hypothetical protein [Colocasia esculenta]